VFTHPAGKFDSSARTYDHIEAAPLAAAITVYLFFGARCLAGRGGVVAPAITLGVAGSAVLLASYLADAFGVAASTVTAAGLAFFADRWRILGLEVMNMRRQRRRWALSSLAYSGALLALMTVTLHWFTATPSVALYVYATTAAVFAAIGTGPLIAEIAALPTGSRSNIGPMVIGFGAPFGLLLLLQWVQGFADRFLIKALIEDATAVGLYAAAYQVCGAPFTLVFRITQNLLRPVAYQKGDHQQPETLWSADRVLLGGTAFQLVCGVNAVILLVWLGPSLIVLLTNSTFQVERTTVAALAAGRFAQMIAASIQPIFAVHRAMNRLLYYRLGGAVLTVALCYPLTLQLGVFGTALGTSLALTSYLLILLIAPKGAMSLLRSAHREAIAAIDTGNRHQQSGREGR